MNSEWRNEWCKKEENHATAETFNAVNREREREGIRRNTVIPSVIQLFIYFDVEQGALIQKVNIYKLYDWEDEKEEENCTSMRYTPLWIVWRNTLLACFIVGTFSSSSSSLSDLEIKHERRGTFAAKRRLEAI